MPSRFPVTGFVLLLLAAVAVLILSLLLGSARISPAELLHALGDPTDSVARTVLLDLRLPRTLAAFCVGALLALAGVLLQAMFRNPLADPFVLGVSGGAAIGALLAMLFGASLAVLRLGALAGAAGAVLGVFVLARGGDGARLLLTGVVIASCSGALVTLLLTSADSGQLRGMVFWLSGDLGFAPDPVASLAAVAVALVGAVVFARPLNVLAAGEVRARSVGLDVDTVRWLLFLGSAALTAVAVVAAGTIGFVGLIAPHAARLAFRSSDHRIVAPAATLLGGSLLVGADILARCIAAPRQLPVGAVMALVGAPVFVALLRSRSATFVPGR